MKRLVAFLLLFGGALLVVILIDRRPSREAAPADVPSPPPERPAGPAVPEGQTGIAPGARFELRGFSRAGAGGEEPTRFVVRAEESALAADGTWSLGQVVAELFDPLDGAREVELHAAHGTARIEDSALVYEPSLQSLELVDVRALVERGAPVLPLEVRAPRVSMPIESRLLVAPDEALIQGPALLARGRDALLDLPNAQFEFRAGGTVTVERPGGEQALFESTGPLRLYRQSPDAAARAPLFLAGEGGARVRLTGARETDMSARQILVRADESGPGGGFVVRSLEMQDDVLWQTPGMRVAAQRALGELDASGAPSSARFEGLPWAELSLLSAEQLAQGLAAFGDGEVLRLAGEGPMQIATVEERFEVRLQGPATVAAPGADLRAGGDLFGWRDAQGNSGFRAGGGVVLEGERSTLETAELEARFLVAEDPGAPILRVETRGGALLSGTFGPGESFTLATPDRMVAERRGLVWRVLEATNVVLNVEHPDGPFEARARRVLDLDLEQASFRAEGEVSFRGPEQSGEGERMRLDADRSVLLEGTDERPARFESSFGWVVARELEVREQRLDARGGVRTELVAPEGEESPVARFALSSDVLRVDWEVVDEVLARIDLSASGNVETRGQDLGRDSLIRSQRFRVQRPAPGHEEHPESLLLVAEEEVRTTLRDARGTLELESRRLELLRSGLDQSLSAEGDVRFEGTFGGELQGSAERFTLDAAGAGRLTPKAGERLSVHGTVTKSKVPFELSATELQLLDGTLLASEPDVLLTLGEGEAPVEIRARARRLRADLVSVTLEESVSIEGETPKAQPWSLEAERVWFEGDLEAEGGGTLRGLRAEGQVRFALTGTANGYGDSLEGSALGQLKLHGSPATVESRLFRLEAEWIEFDPELQIVVATGSGTILPSASEADAGEPPWKLSYLGARTLIEPDSLVLVLQEPELEYPAEDARLRATWIALWLDRHRWERMPAELRGELPPQLPRELQPVQGPFGTDVFGRLQASPIGRYLNEAYFEGPIELTQGEDLLLRAGAIYLDTVVGHGWISDATVNAIGRLISLSFDKLIIKAQWLRLGADGSLRADSATVTPCDFVVPHLRIVTGDLRITPVPGREEYELSMRDNRIELFGLPRIPLPPIRIGTNEEYEPLWQTLRLANSARFGTLVSAGIRRPAEGVGKAMTKVFRGNPFDYDASYKADASWLGSRGVLLDLGLEAESKGSYWLDMALGGLPDRGEDKGYIRVDEDDRDLFRLWYRADGRWKLGEKDNLDLSISLQTDAGVQSEFFESDFERYERDESYLRWTRASNGRFAEASVVPRLEGFRSEVEELPSVGLYDGRQPLVTLGGVDVLYTGNTSAGYLRRKAGDLGLQSPFSDAPPLADPLAQPTPDGAFADGLGDREVLRLDTEHRLEAPVALGESGVRATPFVGARLTAWSEGADPDQQPERWRTEAGLRLATTFWKRTQAGLHQIVPFVETRAELALEEDGGDPVPLDTVEEPIDGSFVDFGFRGRFGVVGDQSLLDLEMVNTWADGLPQEQTDGWQPTAIFARCEVKPFGHAFELWHDGRHNLADSETVYSLVGVATRWSEDLRLEAGHHRGLEQNGDPSFEAASVRAIYRWTEKWEFEGRQTFSLLEDEDLDTEIVVRRYGHDVVVEFESSVRAGEGTSFTINLKPRFGFRPPRLGYLSY